MAEVGDPAAGASWRSRTWWLLPLCVVATTAVALTVVFVPRLGAHVSVPARLTAAVPASGPQQTTSPSPPATSPSPTTRPSPTHHATTQPTPQVVQPRLPIVTVSRERDGGGEREPADR